MRERTALNVVRPAATLALVLLLSASAFAMSFSELKQNLDRDRNTRAYVKAYWKKVKGRRVSWSGEVVDVGGGFRDRYKVYLRVDSPGIEYNVVLVVKGESAALLKKGSTIRFSGRLHDYSWASRSQIKEFFKDEEWTKEMTVVLDEGRIGG